MPKRKSHVAAVADKILHQTRQYFWPLMLSLLIISLYTVAERGRAYFIKPLLDNFNRDMLVEIAIYIAILSLVAAIFKYLKELYSVWIMQRIGFEYRSRMGAKMMTLPLGYLFRRRAGDIMARLGTDTASINRLTSLLYIDLPVTALRLGIGFGVLIDANLYVALSFLVLGPLFALPIAVIGRRIRKLRRQSLQHMSEFTDSVVQMQSGVKIIKWHGAEERELDTYKTRNLNFLAKTMKTVRSRALSHAIIEIFLAMATVLMIVVVANWFGQLGLTPGAIAQLAMGAAMISTPIRELVRGYNAFATTIPSCERVLEILEEPDEAPDDPGAEPVDSIRTIEFADVVFAYDDEPVLQGVNLKATAGEVIAIVGPSGAGKTTLVDMLFKFSHAGAGEIRINGRNIRAITRKSIVDRLAICGQDPYLFHATILENIRYGRPDAPIEDVREAARLANIKDFIEGLDEGYETMLGERGQTISGGERQRMTIARAVLRNPQVLILDEPTSHLDAESERAVQGAIDNLTRGGTERITFVIAHRLSTIKNADRILVLEGGKIIEEGPHDELIKAGGRYASLHATQFGSGG